jgi:hypothetical protein
MNQASCMNLLLRSAVLTATIFFVAGMASFGGRLSAQDATQSTRILSVVENAEPPGWSVREGDKLFAGYLSDSNGKPIIYPLIGPGGQRMTRNFPMTEAEPHEKSDHDHQRSLWLTHGEVNGIDFWLDDVHCGKIVQQKGTAAAQADGSVVIQTENDWNGPDGKRILSDVRRYTFHSVDGRRLIDCDFMLKATDGDVNFGDTKEGSFGVRVAGTMTVDEKLGGVITNAQGQHDQPAWGKKSAWVDYSGPTDGKTAGITIHDHPESFGYPCRWHVRTYGLFAANPFGVHHFDGGEKTDGVTLKKGESMRLSYRVILHEDGLDPEAAAADSRDYASIPRPPLN